MNKTLKTFEKDLEKITTNFEKSTMCCGNTKFLIDLSKSLAFPKIKVVYSFDEEDETETYFLEYLSVFSKVKMGKCNNYKIILNIIKGLKKLKKWNNK